MGNRFWKVALAVIALMATAMAFYIQFAERRARQEEDRLVAARLESALTESRVRVEALERHRAEIVKEEAVEPSGDQPLPGAVLRRSESGGGSALQQVRASQDEQETELIRLQESLDNLALQMERSDQALRRDLEEIRVGARREREASSKVLILLLIALIPVIVSLWLSGGKEG